MVFVEMQVQDLSYRQEDFVNVYLIPYIGNFSRGFNFRRVFDLLEIAKNRHSEK